MVPLKQYNTQSRISPELLEQCPLNLAPEMYITKETILHPSCHYHGNSHTACPVLIKTKIARFCREQGSSTPNNLKGRVGSHMCSEQDPLSHFKGTLQMDIIVFSQKETGAKSVATAATK